jgi:hypothetical protein
MSDIKRWIDIMKHVEAHALHEDVNINLSLNLGDLQKLDGIGGTPNITATPSSPAVQEPITPPVEYKSAGPEQRFSDFAKDDTVTISPNVGCGGVGRFVQYTRNGAIIDIKGVYRELAFGEFNKLENEYRDLMARGNEWSHTTIAPDSIGRMNDKPEFRPGDMVKIEDVYGAVIGPGLGIFIAYSTSGNDCIISFNDKEILVPTANVSAVLEQDAKDNFNEMDNDGNLSPMSLGSQNLAEEPAMDHKDEFTKWMETVQEALTTETKADIAEDIPAMGNQCGCGAWDCTTCFPDQNEMPGMNGALDGIGGHTPEVVVIGGEMGLGQGMPGEDVCPTCGHSHEDGGMGHEMETEVPFEDGSAGGMGAGGMATNIQSPVVDEEPMDFEQEPKALPKGQNGGVKLGDIVQRFVPADQDGEESPLTHGSENLGEEEFDDDFSDLGHYEPSERNMADYKHGMEFATQSDADIEGAEDMMHKIMYMQDMGLSKSSQVYSEADFQNMNPSQLKKCYDAVMGVVSEDDIAMPQQPGMAPSNPSMGTASAMGGSSNSASGGSYPPGTAPTMPESINKGQRTMENVDKDVMAMLKTLKAYDKLTESVAPVLMARPVLAEKGKPEWLKDAEEKKEGDSDSEGGELDEEKEENPWMKLASDKKDQEKSSKTHKGGTVTKTEKGLVHKAADKKEVNEGADQEVLEWMKRFSKLGNMKGYGR